MALQGWQRSLANGCFYSSWFVVAHFAPLRQVIHTALVHTVHYHTVHSHSALVHTALTEITCYVEKTGVDWPERRRKHG